MFVLNHMTPEPVHAFAETPVPELLRLMSDRNIRHLPIIDGIGSVIGMLTDRELISIARREGGPGCRASDVMQPDPATISADAPLGAALTMVCDRRLSALPVVSEGRLVGIITRGDLLKVMCRLLGLDRPGSCIEVALLECESDLATAFAALRETRVPLISAIAACMRDDGDEPVLYLRAERRDRKAIESALSRAGLILLVPENEGSEPNLAAEEHGAVSPAPGDPPSLATLTP